MYKACVGITGGFKATYATSHKPYIAGYMLHLHILHSDGSIVKQFSSTQ